MLAGGILHALKARAKEVAPGVAPTIEGALVRWRGVLCGGEVAVKGRVAVEGDVGPHQPPFHGAC